MMPVKKQNARNIQREVQKQFTHLIPSRLLGVGNFRMDLMAP